MSPRSSSDTLSSDVALVALARKRMAAGALLRDQPGNILLVAPNYRDTLDVPGGEVETEESPHAACRREVAEEIGLDRPVGRVLALDWVPSQPGCPEPHPLRRLRAGAADGSDPLDEHSAET
jgi:ADP-ribose pyrophosphatase YjhB (NUDIX family)